MAQTPNPFRKLKLTPETPHGEVVFEVAAGVFVRATFNLSAHVGWLSRGTIGIWDIATGRYLQRTQDGTHNFRNTLTKDLIIPVPKEGETQSEVFERETKKAANRIHNEFRGQILTSIRNNKDLANHSLGQALDLFGTDYVADRSSSIGVRKTHYNQLQNLANFLGEKPLKNIKRKDLLQFCKLHKGENSSEYISNLEKFLRYASFKIGVEPPCQTVLDSFFQSQKKTKKGDDPDIVDTLPTEYEDKLDAGCWANLGSPFWGIAVMAKEGGLNLKAICDLKIMHIIPGATNEEMYVLYKRDDLVSYTTDYSFALSPFGASYFAEYLHFLAETYPSERVAADKFLFAKDDLGEEPLTTAEAGVFIRKDLNRFLFGHAGRIDLGQGRIISTGQELLRNTRKKHLLEDCRFDDDRGAVLFLLHHSLSHSVQSDNYRCFTDSYGRNLLCKRLAQDRHGCRPSTAPKKFTRMSNAVHGEVRQFRFPTKKDACPGKDQILTLTLDGLNPGDQIEVFCREGCYASVSY